MAVREQDYGKRPASTHDSKFRGKVNLPLFFVKAFAKRDTIPDAAPWVMQSISIFLSFT
jgi:hypothetical protein